jgi:hypothetical protein
MGDAGRTEGLERAREHLAVALRNLDKAIEIPKAASGLLRATARHARCAAVLSEEARQRRDGLGARLVVCQRLG